jgi:hypothetical protein
MNPRALPGLCLRPALAVTFALLAALAAGIGYVEWTVRDFAGPNGPVIFQIAYNVLTGALLISLGSFTGKVTKGLETIRLARMVPGLRRQVTLGVLLIIPLAATLALGYLALAVPTQWHAVSPLGQWSLNVFLFCLGLAVGGSWMLVPALLILGRQYRFVAQHLYDTSPAFPLFVLLGAGALVAIWHLRFLPRAAEGGVRWRGLLRFGPAAPDALARRTGERLRDAADWKVGHLRATVPGLLKAAAYERFGQKRGGLAGTTALRVVVGYAVFFALAAVFALKSGVDWRQFGERLFLGAASDVWVKLARVSFAVITGMTAYVASVTLDSSLRSDLWHPVSRRSQAAVTFWARVRQNGTFALVHLGFAVLLLAGFAMEAREWPAAAALSAFLLPGLVACALAPIPQALFPRGADTFHAKADPLLQLAAGLTGGLFCLAIVHGVPDWPATALPAPWSEAAQAASFGLTAVLIYAGYWKWTHYRSATADISRRQSA